MTNQYEGKNGWTRVLFVALFWFIFYLTQLVVAAVVIAQCLRATISLFRFSAIGFSDHS